MYETNCSTLNTIVTFRWSFRKHVFFVKTPWFGVKTVKKISLFAHSLSLFLLCCWLPTGLSWGFTSSRSNRRWLSWLAAQQASVCDEYNFNVRIQIRIYSGWLFMANTNTNIFGSNFLDEYEYEYIRVNKNGRIWIRIRIFGQLFANTNTNTNIYHTLNLK